MEILNFLKQLGFALAGASALWGWIFVRRNQTQTAARMLPLFVGGLIIGAVSWTVLFWLEAGVVFGHEGISIAPTVNSALWAKFIQGPFLLASIVVTLILLAQLRKKTSADLPGLKWFYPLQLFLLGIVISLIGWVGKINGEQLFYFAHGFHSIFTLGTVLTVDYLFFLSRHNLAEKQIIYPIFPLMSKIIWLGLGIDFASVALIHEQAIQFTPKFYFAQTVIGILIINGVFLSGPMTRRLLDSIKKGIAILPGRLNLIADISGSVSVISWITITFIDQFSEIHLNYSQFIFYYLTAIAIAFVCRTLVGKQS